MTDSDNSRSGASQSPDGCTEKQNISPTDGALTQASSNALYTPKPCGSANESNANPSTPHEPSTMVRKTTAGLTANVVQILAALVTTMVIIAPHMEPSQLGQYYLLYTITILTSLLISLGLDSANSVIIGRGESSPGGVHGLSLVATGGLSAIALGIGCLLYPIPALKLVDKVDWYNFLLAMGTVPCILYQNFIFSIFIGTGHLVLMSRLKIMLALLRLCGDSLAVFGGFGARGLVLSFFICSALGALVMMTKVWPIAPPSFGMPLQKVGHMISFGLRSFLGTVANQLHFRTDTFMLNAFKDTAAVGEYSVAVQAAEMPMLFFNAVQNAMFAKISGSDRRVATLLMSFLLRIGVIAWSAIVFFGIAIMPWLIVFLAPHYQASAKAFCFLIAGTTSMGMARVLMPYFMGQLKRPGLLSGLSWLSVAINLTACYFLIPVLSVNGAAIASVISYCSNLAILLICYRHLSGEPYAHFLVPSYRDIKKARILIKRQQERAS